MAKKKKKVEAEPEEMRGIVPLVKPGRPPELLIQEMPTKGIHNGDVGRAISRLDKSKSWKRQQIVVVLPTAELMSAKVALSHWNILFPPNNGVYKILALGMEVGEAYSTAIEQILLHPVLSKFDYLFTLEADNLVTPDCVLKLLEHMEAHPEFSCIGALYYTKGEGGVPQIWGDPHDPTGLNFRPQKPDPNGGLVECCGTGMGANLWRLSMFKDKKLRRPWFVTQKKDGISTQDLYGWQDFRKHGYRCAIACDVKSGHLDVETDIVW